jgi:tetratricopeptide (TPR) repeat protein
LALLIGLQLFSGAATAQTWSEAAANAPLQRGDRAAAVDYAQRWTRAEPQNPIAWARLGLAQDQALNDPRAAVISLQQAVKLDPGYNQAWNAIAMIERKMGNFAGAEEAMRHTAQTPHGRSAYWHLRVTDLAASGHHSAAIEAAGSYEQAIATSNDPHDWYVLANDYSSLGEWERGIAAYRHVIRFDPNIADAWNNMGVAEQRLGQNASAYDDYRKAAALGDSAAAANERNLVAQDAARRQPSPGGNVTPDMIRAARERENLRNCGRYSC